MSVSLASLQSAFPFYGAELLTAAGFWVNVSTCAEENGLSRARLIALLSPYAASALRSCQVGFAKAIGRC